MLLSDRNDVINWSYLLLNKENHGMLRDKEVFTEVVNFLSTFDFESVRYALRIDVIIPALESIFESSSDNVDKFVAIIKNAKSPKQTATPLSFFDRPLFIRVKYFLVKPQSGYFKYMKLLVNIFVFFNIILFGIIYVFILLELLGVSL